MLDKKHITKEEFFILYSSSKDLANSKIDNKEILRIKAHINECAFCKNQYSILENLYFKESKKYKNRKYVRNSLATISIIIIISTLFFKSEKDSPLITNGNNFNIINIFYQFKKSEENSFYDFALLNKNDIGDDYKDDFNQELFINEHNLRSEYDDLIISPLTNIDVRFPLVFKWNKLINGTEIVIKNNKNKILYNSGVIKDSSIAVNIDNNIGLYYWDFRIEGKIIVKRKFYVLPNS